MNIEVRLVIYIESAVVFTLQLRRWGVIVLESVTVRQSLLAVVKRKLKYYDRVRTISSRSYGHILTLMAILSGLAGFFQARKI